MGIFDFFHKDEVVGSRVLVCGLGSRFEELVTTDGQIYRHLYPSTTTRLFSEVQELVGVLSQSYDILHLFCDVAPGGVLAHSGPGTFTGTDLLQKCCDFNVKLLWVASDNPPDLYITAFEASGKRINLVMTIDRNGSKFPIFLENLLFRMHYGDTMPVAWVDLCPQGPHSLPSDVPSTIFFAGRGGVRLR
jgi:hypothetical protein